MKILLIISFLLCFVQGFAQNNSLKVTIKNIKEKKGIIYFGLFDVNDKAINSASQKVDGDIVTTTFINVSRGKYVVKVYQDLNGNKKMDTNFIGIPKEPYGLSNNIRPKFAPPKVKDMIFEVNNNKEILLELQ